MLLLQSCRLDPGKILPKKKEKVALRTLKSNTDIVIKPADKGSAVVVLDKEHYISEAERQLGDRQFYKPLDYDPTLEFQSKGTKTLNKVLNLGYISKENFDISLYHNQRQEGSTFSQKYTRLVIQVVPLNARTVIQLNVFRNLRTTI